jgi:hypothetical protein
MIDPVTALAGIQSAVALIKKVSKTVDDVTSLGPVLSKYFDAKSVATKAVSESKADEKKSSMSIAIEIEMAIHQAEEFEKQLQLLFMQAGKIDVWNKIKERSRSLEIEEAHRVRREKELKIRKRKELQETLEIIAAVLIGLSLSAILIWGFLTYVK